MDPRQLVLFPELEQHAPTLFPEWVPLPFYPWDIISMLRTWARQKCLPFDEPPNTV